MAKRFLYLLLLIGLSFSCEEDDKNTILEEGILRFSWDQKALVRSFKNYEQAVEKDIPKKIAISMQTETGEIVFDNKIMEILELNGSYITESIALLEGRYKVTFFCVLDAQNRIIYSSPEQGSRVANFVSRPLPFDFDVVKNETILLIPEVVSTEGFLSDDFGFSSFSFDIVDVEEANSVKDFVWKAMNLWYYWQPNVSDLDDLKSTSFREYNIYLAGYNSPNDLFQSLRYQKGVTDRFSWFIEDYNIQSNAFQGISSSYGFRIGRFIKPYSNTNKVIAIISYVIPNSPAALAGVVRGDILTEIDNVELNIYNYVSLYNSIFATDTHTFSFSTFNGSFSTSSVKNITSVQLTESPVHYYKIFQNIGGKKVGYLVYNSFTSNFDSDLNAVFGIFKSEGVNELVLDLRYNGGGSVRSSSYLASMINGNSSQGTVFASLEFNAKTSINNGSYYFVNTMHNQELINRLTTLNKLYVLTSNNTASASEMIINGLRPYMPVTVIGQTTYGKNVGSITLFDSPNTFYTSTSGVNPNHNKAMQPIVFKIFNVNGESNYVNGFTPDVSLNEFMYWYNILPFGNENELLLSTALNIISGSSSKSVMEETYSKEPIFMKSMDFEQYEIEMYILPEEVNILKGGG